MLFLCYSEQVRFDDTKKSLKIPQGNQNPQIEEGQTTQWPSIFCDLPVNHFVQLHIVTVLVLRCGVRYDFHVKRWLFRLCLHSFYDVFMFYLCILISNAISDDARVI